MLSGGTPRELLQRDRRRRHRALPGGARHRQAHGRADHRGAAREGGRRGRVDEIVDHRRQRRPAHARAPGPRRASASRAQEADELLAEAAGEHARGPDRRGAEGVAASEQAASARPGVERIQAGARIRRRRGARPLAAAAQARRLRRPAGGEGPARRSSSRPPSGRGEALDHVLLAGPPGLGKTSLAQIVAAELDVPFVHTAGPALERKGDVAAFLTALEPRSRLLRRRDPPAAARARGDLLSRDGGPQAADHGRPGRGRPRGHARPARRSR